MYFPKDPLEDRKTTQVDRYWYHKKDEMKEYHEAVLKCKDMRGRK